MVSIRMNEPTGITAEEIARRLGGELLGDGRRIVRRAAPLGEAGADALSWLGHEKYRAQAVESCAGVVLAPPVYEPPSGQTVIRVADPDLALCSVLRWLVPPPEPLSPGVHPRAVVEQGAVVEGAAIGANAYVGAGTRVGGGTQVHPGVYIGRDVRIGRDCVLWPNVVVRERVTIGDRVIIHANATIGADGFGYLQRDGKHVRIPQVGTVVVEDDVEIGANTAIDRARSGETRIGCGTKIDNLVQIAHNVVIGHDSIIVAQSGISGSCTLGHHVVLAGQTGLIDHVKIGDGATILAQSGVADDVPPGAAYRGSPAVRAVQCARSDMLVRRLPKLAEQLRDLMQRVKRLESAADDRARS
jgi:UDP-3-O-[3-hydroxymyristoyl] glucosamine N-acyltransferase